MEGATVDPQAMRDAHEKLRQRNINIRAKGANRANIARAPVKPTTAETSHSDVKSKIKKAAKPNFAAFTNVTEVVLHKNDGTAITISNVSIVCREI